MAHDDITLEDMLSDAGAADELMPSPLTGRVFWSFRVVVLLVVGAVLLQFFRIGVGAHGVYKVRADANVRNAGVLPAPRGKIIDRYGKVLAANETVFDVIVRAREVPASSPGLDVLLVQFEELFGVSRAELADALESRRGYFDDSITLASGISAGLVEMVSRLDIPGVYVVEGLQRVHEVPYAFAHVLGYTGLVGEVELTRDSTFTGRDVIGRAGLEEQYDGLLRGGHGREVLFRDSMGRVTDSRVVQLPREGNTVRTFIDKEFQEYFYTRLKEALTGLERHVGVGIAVNPMDGEVLALFSIPSYTPENISEYLEGEHLPLFNRAVSGLYSPGSTIKPLVALAGLTEGVVGPDDIIHSQGYIEIPNPYDPSAPPSIFKDWKAHGWVNVRSALARSSNVYFYEVGGGFGGRQGLGISRLREWWKRFRLDQPTEIDLPGEEVGILPNPVEFEERAGRPWLLGDTYNVSIGQGDLLMTPVQLLHYVSALASGGTFYQPRVFEGAYAYDGRAVAESQPVALGDLPVDVQAQLEYVTGGMQDGVAEEYGTARMLSDIPMPIAAKTGSAQVANNTKTNALVVGYAPADDPQIAILVLVEDAKEGSLNVVPVAHDVFLWYYENRLK
jgi:penicillin-binding protein 2